MRAFRPSSRFGSTQALTEAGVRHTIEIYAKAKHGFAVNGHIVYDHDACGAALATAAGALEGNVAVYKTESRISVEEAS